MAIPETISVGFSRRGPAHAKAQVIATGLTGLGVPVLDWWLGAFGEIQMRVRLGGGAERVLQISGFPSVAVSQALALARVREMEAQDG